MSNVRPIPAGYTAVTPFYNIQGAAEAIDFYKQAFGAEVISVMPGPGGLVMHAELRIAGAPVMLSDAMQNPPTLSSTHLYVSDANAWWARAVAAGCTVQMPIADMFWGDRYGVVADRWGNRWAIAQHIEDVTPEEMKRRMDEMMKQQASAGSAPL